jgi:hypothetical protein
VRALILVAAALPALLLGCSDPSNTQYLPVGSRCTMAGQCGTMPFDCVTSGFPGGYCTRPCTTDGDCPLDSACSLQQSCRRRCTSDADCRQSEGYYCAPPTSGHMLCEPRPLAAMDLGRPTG